MKRPWRWAWCWLRWIEDGRRHRHTQDNTHEGDRIVCSRCGTDVDEAIGW